MAFITIIIALLFLPASLFIWSAHSLYLNVAKAKATGLPYLVRWISPINPFWLLWGSSFIRLLRSLGLATPSSNFSRIYSYGWEANERAKIHEDYGDVIFVVHPGGLQLCVANAETIYEILERKNDFRRNMEEFAVLNVYGKNLSTADDGEWQRHRKMTAVTFTERNNEVVWHESLVQAGQMLEYWTREEGWVVRSTDKDTKVLTLNVLAKALFDKEYSFAVGVEGKREDEAGDKSYQYRESLSTILGSIIEIWIFGEEGLKAWWIPASWKKAGVAMATFRSYILGLMGEERGYLRQGNTGRQHLVARLVKASEEEEAEKGEIGVTKRKAMPLTEEEMLSNLFVYAFAGNDTTAIALTNLLVQVAANPDTQEWIAEEIDHYLTTDARETWTYDNFFKLKRCGAVLMESLRIFHPLSQLVKTTGTTSQPLKINGSTYIIPPGTSVHGSLPALNTLPRYWGSDPMTWNPKRIIRTSDSGASASIASEQVPISSTNPFAKEVLAADTSEHFMPWAWGQRVCPGKRFSQVELVAIMAALFQKWRVEPAPEKGETLEQARNRAWNASLVVEHEGKMLHEMWKPEAVGLRWRRSKTA